MAVYLPTMKSTTDGIQCRTRPRSDAIDHYLREWLMLSRMQRVLLSLPLRRVLYLLVPINKRDRALNHLGQTNILVLPNIAIHKPNHTIQRRRPMQVVPMHIGLQHLPLHLERLGPDHHRPIPTCNGHNRRPTVLSAHHHHSPLMNYWI